MRANNRLPLHYPRTQTVFNLTEYAQFPISIDALRLPLEVPAGLLNSQSSTVYIQLIWVDA